jgi:hypothetical protein
MDDIVERLRAVGGYFDKAAFENGVSCSAVADEIESLRQQLAESQAREEVLRGGLVAIIDDAQESVDHYHAAMKGYRQARHDRMDEDIQIARDALALPFDSTALDAAIRQAKREALLDAAKLCENLSQDETWAYIECSDAIERMADELK